MKFHYLSLILITNSILSSVHFDQEIIDQMKNGAQAFCKQCDNLEKEFNTQFSLCRIAEKNCLTVVNNNLDYESFLIRQDSRDLADELWKKIENLPDYQKALEQTKTFNTDEAWRIVHDIVYRSARELIEQESDLRFPSLKKNYTDMNQKLLEFAVANQNIDPEKNAPYMQALSIIIFNVRYMKKHHSKNQN